MVDLVSKAKEQPSRDETKLRRELATAKAAATSAQKHRDQAEQELADAYRRLELYESLDGCQPNPPVFRAHKSRGQATAIIGATDWHAEQRVDLAAVNGLNEFNLSIAERRIDAIWPKAVYLTEAARKLSNIRHCVVAALGDMLTGYIHDELVETNFSSPVQASWFVAEKLGGGLQYLLDHGDFDFIDFYGKVGNHGRTTQKMRVASRVENNYEWLIYKMVAKQFAGNKKIRFHVDQGYHTYADIQGWTFRLHHGDGLRYGGGVGGLSIPVNKAIGQWNKSIRADYDIFGHWHQFWWCRNWVCCPSLIGYDTWSLWIKAEYEDPAQMFGVVDRDRGLTEVRRIFIENAKVK